MMYTVLFVHARLDEARVAGRFLWVVQADDRARAIRAVRADALAGYGTTILAVAEDVIACDCLQFSAPTVRVLGAPLTDHQLREAIARLSDLSRRRPGSVAWFPGPHDGAPGSTESTRVASVEIGRCVSGVLEGSGPDVWLSGRVAHTWILHQPSGNAWLLLLSSTQLDQILPPLIGHQIEIVREEGLQTRSGARIARYAVRRLPEASTGTPTPDAPPLPTGAPPTAPAKMTADLGPLAEVHRASLTWHADASPPGFGWDPYPDECP